MMKKPQGFTLIEMLISMAIFGILMLAFTQIFGGSLKASSEINSRNELVSEGQIAQQLVASRLQSAYFVYPTGQTMQLTTGGTTTPNTVRSGAGQNWTVGTDPFIAVILPPTSLGQCPTGSLGSGTKNACFTFYAYYPILRSTFIGTNSSIAPAADPTNANVWFLMEYRANLYDGVNRSSNLLLNSPNTSAVLTNSASTQPTIKGNSGQILVDYVQPTTSAPAYTMFRVCNPSLSTASPNCPAGTTATSPKLVDFDLRLLQNRVGKLLTAPAGANPLSTRMYPRNWF